MPENLLYRAIITGTGSYLPEKVLTNQDLEKTLDTSDEWIRTRTGISERRIAHESESASVLAAHAARKALKAAGLEADDLNVIIVCTSTPDLLFPATACFVQKELGASKSAAFDVSAVCSGFVYGLSIAEQYIKSGRYQHILVVGSEVNSRIVDWTDRNTCVLFGDGAGAVVVSRKAGSEPCGVLSSHIYSDGNLSNLIEVPKVIGRSQACGENGTQDHFFIKMAGGATFKEAVKRMTAVCLEALEYNGLSKEDVDLVIPHQANKRIIDAVTEKLQIPAEKVFMNIHKYGNTSAASIPIAINEAKELGRIQPGCLMLMMVVGSGLTWGAAVIRW
ncbi:MAG: ketoacyl-ACP synthase III [Nitrospinae bacterium]|jgi:3-oxoacyl-[acyl-carrier-protein] synthase III|nr:ketoacyl-ACP synthase III [Nitrospinota bacterium]MDA1108282.1 ketoacyl-ACP synthase III [Nitrospinota bacterium]